MAVRQPSWSSSPDDILLGNVAPHSAHTHALCGLHANYRCALWTKGAVRRVDSIPCAAGDFAIMWLDTFPSYRICGIKTQSGARYQSRP